METHLNEERMVVGGRGPADSGHTDFPRQIGAVLNVQLVQSLDVVGGEGDGHNDGVFPSKAGETTEGVAGVLTHPRHRSHLRLPDQAVGKLEVELLHHSVDGCRNLLQALKERIKERLAVGLQYAST